MDDLRERIFALIADSWQARRSGPLPAIADDDNLFDLGVVDSLMMMEIVTVVEDACDVTIDFLSVDPEIFFTIRGILDLQRDLTAGTMR